MKTIFQWIKNHKILTIILVIVFLVIVGSSGASKTDTSTDRASDSTTKTQEEVIVKEVTPDITTTVKAIVDEFENNAIGAEAKYENKLIQVSGITGSINEDILGTPFVMLHDVNDTYQFSGVQCMFSRNNKDQLLTLSKGSPLTIQGSISGDVILNVIMRGCEIVE